MGADEEKNPYQIHIGTREAGVLFQYVRTYRLMYSTDTIVHALRVAGGPTVVPGSRYCCRNSRNGTFVTARQLVCVGGW